MRPTSGWTLFKLNDELCNRWFTGYRRMTDLFESTLGFEILFRPFSSLTGWHICLGNKPGKKKIPIWLLSVIYMMPMGLVMKCSSGHSWITNRKWDAFALHIRVLGCGINVLLNRTDLHKTLMGVFREMNVLKAGRGHGAYRVHGQAQKNK